MKCEMQAQIVNEGGTLTNNEDGTVTVENADAVTIVYSTDTDYKNVVSGIPDRRKCGRIERIPG